GTWDRDMHQSRQIYTSSACGICGTASIEAVQRTTTHPIVLDAMSDDGPVAGPVITAQALLRLPDLLREEQKLFGSTGGVHAAGLFRMVRDETARDDRTARDETVRDETARAGMARDDGSGVAESGPAAVADRVETLAV